MDPIPLDTAPSDEVNTEWKYDLLIDALLAFGIALNVYLLVDTASNGRLSQRTRQAVKQVRIRYAVLRHRQTVIDDATRSLYIEPKETNE